MKFIIEHPIDPIEYQLVNMLHVNQMFKSKYINYFVIRFFTCDDKKIDWEFVDEADRDSVFNQIKRLFFFKLYDAEEERTLL